MFKKILVPLDGSKIAEAVIPFASEIATRSRAELLFVTAVQQVGVWDAALSLQVLKREAEVAADYLATVERDLSGEGQKVATQVLDGDAAEAVLAAVEEAGADLIAISTHGRSGVSRWLFGSVATHILERAAVPLLVLRPKEGEDRGAPGPVVKKILVPLDGSEVAKSILPVIEEFAKTMGASLVLYHSVAPLSAYPGFESAGAAALGEAIEEMQRQAKEILARAAEEVVSRGVEATTVVSLGTPVDGVLTAANELDVDLIAIATHGRSGFGRAVLGSVADGVIRRSADVPCLVVRPTG
ncbi:MAG TPA: universal stress protein [Dehalococcoidia bacterium]